MAGDWQKWVEGLEEKPEVLRMASLLNRTNFDIAGRLVGKIWAWCGRNISEKDFDENGNAFVTIAPLQASFIDSLAGVTGFADSMASVGWLNSRNGRLEFPNFARHNGKPAKDRALGQKRVQKLREKCNENVTQTPLPEKRREEKRRVKNTKPPKPPFQKPTLEEVKTYCQERENRIDPEQFFAHYEANGWVQGNRGKPLKDWKAAVITWEKNGFHNKPATNGKPTHQEKMDNLWESLKRKESNAQP